MVADYADDIAILASIPTQVESQVESVELVARGIDLYVNANKTEYMCFNREGAIPTLNGNPLKLIDRFTYLGSSVPSAESDVNMYQDKDWAANNRLSIIWKSDIPGKMKRDIFQATVVSILLYGCTTWTLTKRIEKTLDGNCTRFLKVMLNKSWQQHIIKKNSCTTTYFPSLKLSIR